jgi:hypothetical protein
VTKIVVRIINCFKDLDVNKIINVKDKKKDLKEFYRLIFYLKDLRSYEPVGTKKKGKGDGHIEFKLESSTEDQFIHRYKFDRVQKKNL